MVVLLDLRLVHPNQAKEVTALVTGNSYQTIAGDVDLEAYPYEGADDALSDLQ